MTFFEIVAIAAPIAALILTILLGIASFTQPSPPASRNKRESERVEQSGTIRGRWVVLGLTIVIGGLVAYDQLQPPDAADEWETVSASDVLFSGKATDTGDLGDANQTVEVTEEDEAGSGAPAPGQTSRDTAGRMTGGVDQTSDSVTGRTDGIVCPAGMVCGPAPTSVTSSDVLVPSLDCPRDPRCGNLYGYQGEAIICSTGDCSEHVFVVDCSVTDCGDYPKVIECGVLGCEDDLEFLFGPGVGDCPIGGCVGQAFDAGDDFTGDCSQSVTSRCDGDELPPWNAPEPSSDNCSYFTDCGSSWDGGSNDPGGSVLSRDDPYGGGLPGSCSQSVISDCD